VPHIYWSRLCGKVEDISTDSAVRTCTDSAYVSKALEVAFGSSDEAVENLRQTKFRDNGCR